MSGREGEFPHHVKMAAYNRQTGLCANCGVKLMPPSPMAMTLPSLFHGEAHHLRPLLHGGWATLDNCIYLCYACHKLMGHGMSPYGIDKQGGSSKVWIQLSPSDFKYWNGKK
jgi:5-methylcytosine-specific restriction endonuclease McrA